MFRPGFLTKESPILRRYRKRYDHGQTLPMLASKARCSHDLRNQRIYPDSVKPVHAKAKLRK